MHVCVCVCVSVGVSVSALGMGWVEEEEEEDGQGLLGETLFEATRTPARTFQIRIGAVCKEFEELEMRRVCTVLQLCNLGQVEQLSKNMDIRRARCLPDTFKGAVGKWGKLVPRHKQQREQKGQRHACAFALSLSVPS